MHTLSNPASPPGRVRLFLERRVAGPFILGLIFGGVPFGIVFAMLGGDVVSPNLLARGLELTPLAIIVAAVGAAGGSNVSLVRLFERTLIVSIGECIPLPILACAAAMWHAGYQVFLPENLPVLVFLLSLWAVAVTLVSFCIASLFYLVKARRSTPAAGAKSV